MKMESFKLWTVLVLFITFLSIIITILSGLFKVLLLAIFSLIVVSLIAHFISKKYPNSRVGGFINKVLSWIKEFLNEIIPFI